MWFQSRISGFSMCLVAALVCVAASLPLESSTSATSGSQPVLEQRTFKAAPVKLPLLKKHKKFGGWLPHVFGKTEYRTGPHVYKVHRYHGLEMKPVHVSEVPFHVPELPSTTYLGPVTDHAPFPPSGPVFSSVEKPVLSSQVHDFEPVSLPHFPSTAFRPFPFVQVTPAFPYAPSFGHAELPPPVLPALPSKAPSVHLPPPVTPVPVTVSKPVLPQVPTFEHTFVVHPTPLPVSVTPAPVKVEVTPAPQPAAPAVAAPAPSLPLPALPAFPLPSLPFPLPSPPPLPQVPAFPVFGPVPVSLPFFPAPEPALQHAYAPAFGSAVSFPHPLPNKVEVPHPGPAVIEDAHKVKGDKFKQPNTLVALPDALPPVHFPEPVHAPALPPQLLFSPAPAPVFPLPPVKYESFPPNHPIPNFPTPTAFPQLYNSYAVPIPHDTYGPPNHVPFDRVSSAATEEKTSVLPAPPSFTEKTPAAEFDQQPQESQQVNESQKPVVPEEPQQEQQQPQQPAYVPENAKSVEEEPSLDEVDAAENVNQNVDYPAQDQQQQDQPQAPAQEETSDQPEVTPSY